MMVSFWRILMVVATSWCGGVLAVESETTEKGNGEAIRLYPRCPSEVFGHHAKAGRPQWRQFYRSQIQRQPANRYHAALGVGALYADILLAAEARDAQQVRNLLQDLEALEKMLGLAESAGSARQQFAALAQSGDWTGIRGHLRDVIKLHARLLNAQRDEALTELAFIGEWLRGMQISTGCGRRQTPPNIRCFARWKGLTDELRRRVEELQSIDEKSIRLVKRHVAAIGKPWRGEITPESLAKRLEQMEPLINEAMRALVDETSDRLR
jgi:hypothetical protein